ncbi:glycosyltransferase [Synechococcus sp. BA-124 BA4]|uniref:glycosyltransferase n=1 Tax=Synechococcus sp. BA-124 BA4 TaxID=3110251 RepID=UPI002B1F3A02|nr:glycosyltransferase [Synechococcus sp. BA-124 BA4]MEA5398453.1 glycosyltransferase [Synechococcus sp. BA-124 BA4]
MTRSSWDGPAPIPIFIGYDPRERAAANVLIDSLYQHSSAPLAITLLVTPQLERQGLYRRKRDPKQSTAFSFTRFLVPHLMDNQGWAVFMDCDMLCRGDIAELWAERNDDYALMCVQHQHVPAETVKFLGEVQSAYPKKNWSSLMLLNCGRCRALTPEYVNSASGLELHRFHWLAGDHEIGALPDRWNHLVGVQPAPMAGVDEGGPILLHWTLGGPWFREQRTMGGHLAAEWFSARDEAMQLWG